MKKIKNAKMFITGLVVGLLLAGTTVLAANAIASATFNDTRVIFNGEMLELPLPLISVITEANPYAISNYMPVRAVLEAMGYVVDWDGENNAILVSTPQAITPQAGYISLDEVMETPIPFIPQGFIPYNDIIQSLVAQGIYWAMAGNDRTITFSSNLGPGMPDLTLYFGETRVWDITNTIDNPLLITPREHPSISITFISIDGITYVNEAELTYALRTVGLIP